MNDRPAAVELPPGADAVIAECAPLTAVFAAAGWRLYLVGGIVRDLFTGADGPGSADWDLDLTTDAVPAEVRHLIGPIVDNLWTQGERFGTIAAHLGGRLVEITTHRAEAYDPESRKPAVVFATDVAVDLSRRDFTVNAIAIELTSEHPMVIDPFGGRADLERARLATPLEPVESFSDDPLRMLRAARFVARLGLRPDPAVVSAMADMAERLQVVSVERRRDEFDKLLALPDPTAGLRLLVETGLAAQIVPELDPGAVERVAAAPTDPLTRLAVLLAPGGPEATRTRLRALRRSRTETATVLRVVVAVPTLVAPPPDADGPVRRLVHEVGPELGRALDVAAALGGPPSWRRRIEDLAAREDLGDLGPCLDGAEVMEVLGLTAGPEVGRAVAFLQDLRLDEGVVPRSEAIDRLRRAWTASG